MKNTHEENFEQVEKFMPCFFSSNAILFYNKIRQYQAKRFEKTLSVMFLDFLLLSIFTSLLKKKEKFYFFWIFEENLTF